MARRRPGAFLIGAATAGVLAGRLTRGAVDANRDTSPPRPIAAEPVTAPLLPAAGAPLYPSGPPPAYPPSPAYAPPAPHGYSPGPGAGPPPITEPRPYAPDVPVDPEAWGEPGPGSAHAPRPGTTAGAEYGQEFGRPGTPRDDDPLQPGGFR